MAVYQVASHGRWAIQRRVGGSRERARGTEENSVLFRSSAADTYIRDLSYIVHGEQYQRNTNPRT